MKVVILCGGFGSRIRDVAVDIPKPMIFIGNKPILWHIMKYYAAWDFNEFILCLGYKARSIKDFFINYELETQDLTVRLGEKKSINFHHKETALDWKVTLAETGLQAMTGARIKRIRKYIGEDKNFLLTYGDGVADVNLKKLTEFHINHGKTLTVTGVRPPGRFGEIMREKTGKVTEFNEKPQATEGIISGGFFVCKREIFDYLDDSEDLVFEKQPIMQMVDDEEMMLFEHDGFWQPMDTYREYSLLNQLYKEKKAPWVIW